MKVICLVPSWTEMLIECGVNIVGRTRFCVHPQDRVKSIPVVGGTKDLDWDKVRALHADLLILDREENLPWMQEESPIPVHVTHVTSVRDVAREIHSFAPKVLADPDPLLKVAERWDRISNRKQKWDWNQIPAEIECLRRDFSSYERLVYVIWKKPWMRVAGECFISSVLEHLGAGEFLVSHSEKYPEFQFGDFDLKTTYFLFSSEPYPFHRQKETLQSLGVQGSIIDGESFSWFGLRALRFLEHDEGQ